MFQLNKPFGSSLLTTICAGLDAVATALGMTAEELSAEFRKGKVLAQVAVEKGLDPIVVQQAIHAATKAGPKAAIQQAVADGQLSQDNADWLLLGLEKDYWGAGQILSAAPQTRADPSRHVSQSRQPNLIFAYR